MHCAGCTNLLCILSLPTKKLQYYECFLALSWFIISNISWQFALVAFWGLQIACITQFQVLIIMLHACEYCCPCTWSARLHLLQGGPVSVCKMCHCKSCSHHGPASLAPSLRMFFCFVEIPVLLLIAFKLSSSSWLLCIVCLWALGVALKGVSTLPEACHEMSQAILTCRRKMKIRLTSRLSCA